MSNVIRISEAEAIEMWDQIGGSLSDEVLTAELELFANVVAEAVLHRAANTYTFGDGNPGLWLRSRANIIGSINESRIEERK